MNLPIRPAAPGLSDAVRRRTCAPLRSTRAFTLVEIMVVVLIISMLVTASIPAIKKVQRRAKTAALINDFRTFAAAFEAYAAEKGTWPAETAAGVVPPEMADRFKDVVWTRVTPVGGKYNWDYDQLHAGTRYKAAISIEATDDAPIVFDGDQYLDIDEKMDDGNLSTGNFILGAGMRPVYIIEK